MAGESGGWDFAGAFAGGLADWGIASWQQAKQSSFAREMFDKNAELQREFAQNGLSWRVQDAVRAGLNPLVGAGVSPQSASPIAVNADFDAPALGQNISRAIHAASPESRRSATLSQLAVERAKTENEILKTELASKQRTLTQQVGPAMASAVENNIVEGQPGSGRAFPEIAYVQSDDGRIYVIPSQQFRDRAGTWDMLNWIGRHGFGSPKEAPKDGKWKAWPYPPSYWPSGD